MSQDLPHHHTMMVNTTTLRGCSPIMLTKISLSAMRMNPYMLLRATSVAFLARTTSSFVLPEIGRKDGSFQRSTLLPPEVVPLPVAGSTIPPLRMMQDPFSFLFPDLTTIASLKSDKGTGDAARRQQLKMEILEVCRSNNIDRRQQRAQVEEIIESLRNVSPVRATSTSPLLQRKWKLIWTTEKEINFFLDNGWANEITQTIQGPSLQNNIPFVGGGGLSVEGSLNVAEPESSPSEEDGVRTEFVFTSAILDLSPRWGQWNLPPVGKGWFDTIYLDDTLRVDTNSRNDILICEPYPEV